MVRTQTVIKISGEPLGDGDGHLGGVELHVVLTLHFIPGHRVDDGLQRALELQCRLLGL